MTGMGKDHSCMANGVYHLSLFIRFSALAGQVGGPGRARPAFFRSLPLMPLGPAVSQKIMETVQSRYVPAFEAFQRRFLELEKEESS